MEILSVLFFGNLVLSLIAGYVAKGKGRSAFGFFLLSVFFSFLLTILVLIALPPLKPSNSSQSRECPFCKEQILRQASVCKHCGRDVEPMALDVPSAQAQAIADYKGNKWLTLGGILMLLGVFMVWIWWTGIDDPSIPTYSRVISLVIELGIFALGVFWVIKGNLETRQEKAKKSVIKSEGSK